MRMSWSIAVEYKPDSSLVESSRESTRSLLLPVLYSSTSGSPNSWSALNHARQAAAGQSGARRRTPGSYDLIRVPPFVRAQRQAKAFGHNTRATNFGNRLALLMSAEKIM